MKRLIIGDIHGCYDELQALLDKAGLSSDDEIIAIGDIVDRGPDTPKVLDFFRAHPKAQSIIGNHERKHIRSYRGEIQPALSQVISRAQFGDGYADAVAFMQTFPLFIDLPEALLVHGFWEPGVPLTEQRENVLAGVMSGEGYLQHRYGWPWYDYYDGPKPIIVGHRQYLENGKPLIVGGRVFAIDTGCVRGGTLTGLILPDFTLISVRACENYWFRVSQTFVRTEHFALGEIPPWDEEADKLLTAIFNHILQVHEKVLADLASEPSFNELTPRQPAKMYAEKVEDSPLRPWLHRARQGKLTTESLRRYFQWPERAESFARDNGVEGYG
jgi:serine/threonine protein phosphatase 1